MRPALRRARGFSLLEILVAFAIAALALGMLDQVTGNNARQAGGLGQQERAMLLAESLLAAHATVPPQGIADTAQPKCWQPRHAPYCASPTPSSVMAASISVSSIFIVSRRISTKTIFAPRSTKALAVETKV